ncbi:MAG TPA: ABC transporter substrate-binding protein [Solirubrobacteraceae bacterium]|nr:ABC transporter substrate-binding protein [Solirubrobacteraceae bacterium]
MDTRDRRRRICAAVAAAAATALLALAGWGGDGDGGGGDQAQRVATVKVGVLPISNVAPLYLGIKKGFFRAERLEVQPVPAQSGNEIVAAMVSGADHFAFLGYVPAMSARSQRLPIKLIANADNGADDAAREWTVIVVRKDSPIRGVEDLAGQTIAVNAIKGVGEVVIKAALDERGVDPDSIKLLEIPFPEMPAALDRKRVDAIWVPEPFLTQVLGEGGREIEAPLTTLGKRFPNGTYATTERYLGALSSSSSPTTPCDTG